MRLIVEKRISVISGYESFISRATAIEKLNDLFIRECSLSRVAPKIENV